MLICLQCFHAVDATAATTAAAVHFQSAQCCVSQREELSQQIAQLLMLQSATRKLLGIDDT
jgi:hypothetical protein